MQIFEGARHFPRGRFFEVNLLVPCTRTVMSDCIDIGSRGANAILRRPQRERQGYISKTNFTTNSNTGRTPLMSFFCYFWGIVSCLLPNNVFTFAVAHNYFRVKTNNTTVWDLGWHGETLPFCHYWDFLPLLSLKQIRAMNVFDAHVLVMYFSCNFTETYIPSVRWTRSRS
jgi:hypothetical protein